MTTADRIILVMIFILAVPVFWHFATVEKRGQCGIELPGIPDQKFCQGWDYAGRIVYYNNRYEGIRIKKGW